MSKGHAQQNHISTSHSKFIITKSVSQRFPLPHKQWKQPQLVHSCKLLPWCYRDPSGFYMHSHWNVSTPSRAGSCLHTSSYTLVLDIQAHNPGASIHYYQNMDHTARWSFWNTYKNAISAMDVKLLQESYHLWKMNQISASQIIIKTRKPKDSTSSVTTPWWTKYRHA